MDYLTTHTSLSPIRRVFAPGIVNYKKGALDSQPQVIKFTSCLPMLGGSLRLLLPLKLVAMVGYKIPMAMQSVAVIATDCIAIGNVVTSNPDHEIHYVMKFVSSVLFFLHLQF